MPDGNGKRALEKSTKLYYGKWALIWFCVVAIIGTFIYQQYQNSLQNEHITRIESPCQHYGPTSPQCHESFGTALRSITKAQLCEALEVVDLHPDVCVRIKRHHTAAVKKNAADRHPAGTSPSGSHSPDGQGIAQTPSTPAPAGSGHQSPEGSAPAHQGGRNPQQPHEPPPQQNPGQSPSGGGSPSAPGAPEGGSSTPPPGQPSPVQESPPSSPPLVEVTVGPVGATVGGESAAGVTAPLPVQACVPPLLTVNC